LLQEERSTGCIRNTFQQSLIGSVDEGRSIEATEVLDFVCPVWLSGEALDCLSVNHVRYSIELEVHEAPIVASYSGRATTDRFCRCRHRPVYQPSDLRNGKFRESRFNHLGGQIGWDGINEGVSRTEKEWNS
jgi:hypothetical protein